MGSVRMERLCSLIKRLRARNLKISDKEKQELLAEFEAVMSEPELKWERFQADLDWGQRRQWDAPDLHLQKTMLFLSGIHKKRCNFLTAKYYRGKIQRAYQWAQAQGIDTFLADYSVPFGLLAAETLLELREAGADFHLFLFRTRYVHEYRSYRLIPETGRERILTLSQADHIYCDPVSEQTLRRLYLQAKACCDERGI